MPTLQRIRLVNPRLGTYFGIFASAFIGFFLILLIFEELQASGDSLELAALVCPLALFVAIGLASLSMNSGEFFAAGRRVPAVYNGLAFAISAIGGTGIVVITGIFFINGFDAWLLAIGISSGFLVTGIAISPYLRKYGAYTVPSYLAGRLESRFIRILAAMLFAVPILLLLAAELAMAVHVAALLTGYPQHGLSVTLSVVIGAMIMFGGMRAVGWVTTAQAIAALIAIIALTAIMGVILTNLPLAQLSYGPVLRQIVRLEEAQRLDVPARAMFDMALAGQAPMPVGQHLATPFTSVGWAAFVASSLVIMMGIAGAPWLLPRCATTLGVYEARKTLGWAIFFVGAIILSLSALAVFLRGIVTSDLLGRSSEQLPVWFSHLTERGLAGIVNPGVELSLSDLQFTRDGILYAVPLALDFPVVLQQLVLAGAIAAALAGAAATAFALAAILSEDVFNGLKWSPPDDTVRTNTTRIMIVAVLAVGLLFNMSIRSDPLELFLTAITLSASTAFPVTILSIWWKRLNVMGAASSMIAGFSITIALLSASAGGIVELATPLAGIVAVPVALLAAMLVSVFTPAPGAGALEAARDMRIPGGETIYDREMRLLRFSQRGND